MKPSFTFSIDTSIFQKRIFSNPFLENHIRHSLVDPMTTDPTNVRIQYGIFLPDPWFFLQLGIILFIQASICCLISIFTYFTIIKQGEMRTIAFLSGFGIVLPLLLYMPFWFIPYFQIYNTIFIFAVLTTPILTVFKCLEAIYGTCPYYAQQSLTSFISYYSWAIPMDRDPSTGQAIRLSWDQIHTRLRLYLRTLLVGGILYSILYPLSFQPYPRVNNDIVFNQSSLFTSNHLIHLLHWKHLLNNFILTYVLFNNLVNSSSSVGLVTSFISGCNTVSIMNNPLFSSSSPSDFWGSRWNLVVHGLLKRGVYIPFRKSFPKASMAPTLGVIMTFVASGLIHEYIVYVFLSLKCQCFDKDKGSSLLSSSSFFYASQPVSDHRYHYNKDMSYHTMKGSGSCCYPPVLGNALYFFLWNSILVFIDRCLKPIRVFQRLASKVPTCLLTTFVIMTALPIAHWFTDPYLHVHFFHDAIHLFPIILRL